MRVAFFEDESAANFTPIALLRPVFELVCGQFSLRERIIRRFPVSDWGVFLRPELAECYREEHPEAAVNDMGWLQQGPTLLLNGRWLPSLEALANIDPETVGLADGEVVHLTLDPAEAALLDGTSVAEAVSRIAESRRTVAADGLVMRHPWDLVGRNSGQLIDDFRMRQYPRSELPPSSANVVVLGETGNVFIDPRAQIDPFVVLDARSGPISIEAEVVIQPFTRIEGPCHIGRGAQLFRANIREGTTIGPHCRVGGEIEESILHGYVNKYHDGFLGHGYICPWVNLGAMTTNSDLKNDYSPVRVPIDGVPIDTGSTKVGCFIGDHTKTALGSLFNTGSNIGVMCMVLPAGELLPKEVPSFSRIWHGLPDDGLDLQSGLQTARKAMGRRNRELTTAQEQLLRYLHQETQPARSRAILRFREKLAAREEAVFAPTTTDG